MIAEKSDFAEHFDTGDARVSVCYEHGPFGELTRASSPMAKANPFRFSTKYQDDESDLLYYGFRYLNTSTGKWLSRDPKEERGGIALYAICQNDAIGNVDTDGRDVWETISDIIKDLVKEQAVEFLKWAITHHEKIVTTDDVTCPSDSTRTLVYESITTRSRVLDLAIQYSFHSFDFNIGETTYRTTITRKYACCKCGGIALWSHNTIGPIDTEVDSKLNFNIVQWPGIDLSITTQAKDVLLTRTRGTFCINDGVPLTQTSHTVSSGIGR